MRQESGKSFFKKAGYVANSLLMLNPLFYAPAFLCYQQGKRAFESIDDFGDKISSLDRLLDGVESITLGAVAVGVGLLEGFLIYNGIDSAF
jgi:hypothetical protein